ncbi:hypothetical protein RD055328_00140 [Companilactobacillus sp. RD055328]|uniref:DUF948 domain-containing protein n=1 Tax=Companilactobacillus sp. RD055328 TaxID=2916634 RepID=UPI001FC8D1C6|nr:DUF948 domain-containing protein [Companilactobacillus sp. RD055328]GKQ42091.1 hypothetical protein RD055328_00140 [Companilactobacillus sp. RD055328]
MNLGQIAALIAALAFAALVIYLIVLLIQATKVMKELVKTVEVVTQEADQLLEKTNVLVDDVSFKMETLNPLFMTVENLGVKAEQATSNEKSSKTSAIMGNAIKAATAFQTVKSFMPGHKKSKVNDNE